MVSVSQWISDFDEFSESGARIEAAKSMPTVQNAQQSVHISHSTAMK